MVSALRKNDILVMTAEAWQQMKPFVWTWKRRHHFDENSKSHVTTISEENSVYSKRGTTIPCCMIRARCLEGMDGKNFVAAQIHIPAFQRSIAHFSCKQHSRSR